MKVLPGLLLSLVLAAMPAQAQHEHHHAPPDTTGATTHEENRPAPDPPRMPGATLPGLPMERAGSGTSWLPDASPVYGAHASLGTWSLMLHGTAFLRYTAQDVFERGNRGARDLDAPNWFMGMAARPVGARGQLTLRGMFSLDPITQGGDGYPLLFQTGETYDGEALVDRQHPHDLFTELSATFGQALGPRGGVFVYLGLPGEPALGPPAFMHRPSARHNPDAPLGHHWQDATHVTFGVATLGLRLGPAMVEGSLFTGREPDEERYGFDRPRFDSYSLRLSANPTDRLALQVSRGFLKSPEWLASGTDVWRTTASALYHHPLRGGIWTSTLLWGMNQPSGDDGHGGGEPDHHGGGGAQHTFLAESDVEIGRQAVYARAEWVEKPAGELGFVSLEDRTFGIGAFTLGTARTLLAAGPLRLMLGLQGTIYRVPAALEPEYGANPVSLEAYLRFSPRLLGAHHAHDATAR